MNRIMNRRTFLKMMPVSSVAVVVSGSTVLESVDEVPVTEVPAAEALDIGSYVVVSGSTAVDTDSPHNHSIGELDGQLDRHSHSHCIPVAPNGHNHGTGIRGLF